PEALAELGAVAAALGASVGATRIVTDAGWAPYERQIGTTGVVVDPDLYVAFGVSGAAQHTGGLGAPRHVVSVNTDASCPMTALADLGIVTDARALLTELARRLEAGDA
ncbi:FAD-binding protein, partial [Saccharomonospora iraqiensis]